MKMKRIIILIIAIIGTQTAYSQATKNTDWNVDLDSLAKELPQKHYNFFTVKSQDDFLNGLENIKSFSKKATTLATALRIQQLIAGFGDSHTRLYFTSLVDKTQRLPLQLYWFSDGLFIVSTNQENADILSNKILSVNGFPIKEVVDSLSTLITVDNLSILKSSIPQILPFVQILEYFGFVKEQNIELELQNLAGTIKTHTIKPAVVNKNNAQMCQVDSMALCYRHQRDFFFDAYQSENKLYYLQYNSCWSKELELENGDAKNAENLPSFKEFEKCVFQTIKKESIKKIIFDLRFNGGGSSKQGTQFIEKLAKYLKKNPNIKTYVVLGRATFSSAILNAMDFKQLTNATFVGEETGGKPNHFGEVKEFILPSSGLEVQYSTKYFTITNENEATITPDIKLESSFSDFSKGIDPVYEWVIKQ